MPGSYCPWGYKNIRHELATKTTNLYQLTIFIIIITVNSYSHRVWKKKNQSHINLSSLNALVGKEKLFEGTFGST